MTRPDPPGLTDTFDVRLIGHTSVDPRTTYYWHPDRAATLEVTAITDSLRLVRASKTCRLTKLDQERQENWDHNIRGLNDYLAEHFPRFQLVVDYSNETTPELTGISDIVKDLKAEYDTLQAEKAEAHSDHSLYAQAMAAEAGSDLFQEIVSGRKQSAAQRRERLDKKLDRLTQQLATEKRKHGEWSRHGVSLAYLFTFSTHAELSSRPLDSIAEDKLATITERYENKVKKPLRGPNFKFALEEVDQPRVLNRLEHTTLLDPDSYHQFIVQHPDLGDVLRPLRTQAVAQYEAYALQDLSVDGKVFERSKATPGQAVNAVIQDLESKHVATRTAAPNDGPMIGTLAGTKQVVGFDPTQYFEHVFLAGTTGSGKSYLKRVLLENAASCGAHVLSVTPTDTQSLGLAFAYTSGPAPSIEMTPQEQALAADCYYPESEYGLEWPGDVTELLEGVNALSMAAVDDNRTTELLADLLSAVYGMEFPDEQPLVLGVDEAHTLGGDARQLLKSIVKEKRKDNVHVILATQSPMAFKRQYSGIRENTATQFLRGEYFSYAEDFTHVLTSKQEVADLDRGQAILQSMDLSRVLLDVRPPLSQVEQPSAEQLTALTARYRPQTPKPPKHSRKSNTNREMNAKNAKHKKNAQLDSIESTDRSEIMATQPQPAQNEQHPKNSIESTPAETAELSDLEADLVDWIYDFLSCEDWQYVTARNCWDPEDAPCTSRMADPTLKSLTKKGVLTATEITRKGNQTTGYRPHDLDTMEDG